MKTPLEQLLRDKTPPDTAPCRMGMGCASFGGADSPRRAAKAVAAALDAGVVYFDAARSYGFGQAEEILGRALRGRRDRVVLATKSGTPVRPLHPVQRWLRQRLVRPARWLRSTLRGRARPKVQPVSPGPHRKAPPFSAAAIAADLEASLKALQTDHVDVFHLHLCGLESLSDEVRACLDRIKREGKARLVGVATDAAECERIHRECPLIDVFQLPDSIASPGLDVLASDPPESIVTHSVLGRSPELRTALGQSLRADGATAAWIQERLGLKVLEPSGLIELLILTALHRNAQGVVLLGMGHPKHVQQNVSLGAQECAPEAVDEAWHRLQGLLHPGT